MFKITLSDFYNVIFSALLIFITIVIYIRLCGLKSFSKMTSFDFAMTIAIGSLLATTVVSSSTNYTKGALSIGILFLIQSVINFLRKRVPFVKRTIENSPKFLYKDGKFNEKNMKGSNITLSDFYSKLREANALDIAKVHAVILESTGDVSVLHGEANLSKDLINDIS